MPSDDRDIDSTSASATGVPDVEPEHLADAVEVEARRRAVSVAAAVRAAEQLVELRNRHRIPHEPEDEQGPALDVVEALGGRHRHRRAGHVEVVEHEHGRCDGGPRLAERVQRERRPGSAGSGVGDPPAVRAHVRRELGGETRLADLRRA
jgi:hypothetical protein